MKLDYSVAGEKRRAMVQIISSVIGEKAIYLKVPTCAYRIGHFTVSKSGELIWDENGGGDLINEVVAALSAEGFEAKTELPAMKTEEIPQTQKKPEVIELRVMIPTKKHDGNSLRNLVNLIYTRAGLINKALGTNFSVKKEFVEALAQNENLSTAEDFGKEVDSYQAKFGSPFTGLSLRNNELCITALPETADAEKARAFTDLVGLMNQQALAQKRILAKTVNEENEKYAFRIWLTRMGMNGAEYKATRKTLMKNLSGSAAFRTDAEKEKWMQRRAAEKEAK